MSKVKKTISSVEEMMNKSLSDFNEDDFALLFREVHASSSTFANYKTEIRSIVLERCAGDSRVLKCLDEIQFRNIHAYLDLERKYFKNFQTLNKAIKDTLDIIGVSGSFDTAITCIYLAFYGVPYRTAPLILKANVSSLDNLIELPNGLKVEIGDYAMDFIRSYAKSDSFEFSSRGGIWKRYYKESQYLLRSSRQSQLQPSRISFNISNFERAGESKVSFQYSDVYQSGIFYRIWLKKAQGLELPNVVGKKRPDKKDLELWEFLLNEKFNPIARLYDRIEEYYNWQECFYPDVP